MKYYGWGLPFDASAQGYAIDRLIYTIHGFMLVLFVGWLIFLVMALVKFRARPGHKANYKVNHFKTPTYAEVGVAFFEAFLLVGFSFPIVSQVRNQFPPAGEALHVRVVAEQFAWNFHYPGPDGVFGKADVRLISPANPVGLDPGDPAGKDDVTTINQLHIPVHQPVIAELSSKDVIHSFAIPVMRVKRDVIPGQVSSIWFEAKHTGNFEVACAQLCGLGHYRMRGFLTIDTPEAFEEWMNQQQQAKNPPPSPAPIATAAPSAPTPTGTEPTVVGHT